MPFYPQIGIYLLILFGYICRVKELRRHILSSSLLLVFAAYLGCIVSSYHVNFVDGQLIAHAHPKQNKPFTQDQHSNTELVVLHQFSQIIVSGPILPEIKIGTPLCRGVLLLVPEMEGTQYYVPNYRYLRGPPIVA